MRIWRFGGGFLAKLLRAFVSHSSSNLFTSGGASLVVDVGASFFLVEPPDIQKGKVGFPRLSGY